MKKYDVLVVGAGFFGATFARAAADRGKRCLVVEKRDHVAGNAYTYVEKGITVHAYGPHVFHTSKRAVWDFSTRFATFLPYIHRPVAEFEGKRYALPPCMQTFRALWGVRTPAAARAAMQPVGKLTDARNLEEAALARFGREVYEKIIRGYTEKQWGCTARELPAEILARLDCRFNFDSRYFTDRYQGLPADGYTVMVQRMLAPCEVVTGVDYLAARTELRAMADTVVFTGSIDAYFNCCHGPLAYRTLRFEREVLPVADYQGTAVVNHTDAATPFTRVVEHKHFLGTKAPYTVITREYPALCGEGDEPFYPINTPENNTRFGLYADMASRESGVFFGGRLGSYRYCNMDEAIAEALALAHKIL